MAAEENKAVDNVSEKKKRIDELTERLNEASRAYYADGIEIMTNFEFDAMYDELLALEDETGYIRDDSPSVNVGYDTAAGLPKITHEIKMLSLNKTKDRDELKAWLGDQKGLLSWKLDGLTVGLTYDNGRLVQGVTRGNGTEGELITANVLACRNVPKTIAHKGRVMVRGEAVIRYSDFEKINEAIADADAKYKNPRNLCSGSIRQLDPKVTAERNVRFYAFSLTLAEGLGLNSRAERMEWLKEQGFDTVDYVMVDSGSLSAAIDGYEAAIKDFDIPSDGLVLTLDDGLYAASLGETAKFPRDSIAFKWRDQYADTVLRDIEWSPSRTGLLNPVAIFDPVELEGTTVSRASVHNINIMEDLELGIGDTVRVYKANMIIPQLSDNLTRSGNIEIPSECPVCGGRAVIRDDDGTRTLNCTNPECLAKHVKRFSHFVSRDALNIEGLSEAGLLKLIGISAIKTFPDLFRLEDHRDEIVEMEGFGQKSFDNLIASAQRASRTTPARLLYGLGVPGIGVATSNLIARACRNKWSEIESLDRESLTDIDGVGAVMAEDYVGFFEDEDNRAVISELLGLLELDESYEAAGTELEGKVFVITGSLEHYKSRKELKADIEDHRDEIVELEGFGPKSFDNLIASAERASHTTPARLLYGLGVPGIGVATSNLIAGACRNKWSEIESLDRESLTDIDGVGDVMAGDYVGFFEDEDNRAVIRELLGLLELDESYEAAGTELEGKIFVITGSLEHYKSRKELKADIEAEGGKVTGSVSAKTDYLITNDPGSGSSKNRTARELGVAVITEEDVLGMLGKNITE